MPASVESRFMSLFRGNDRSYGVWFPETTKMSTEKRAVSQKQYSEHLAGKRGLGLVPIMDSGLVWFGVIDIDNHGELEDINLWEVITAIKAKNLPLVACRSKSGGIHAYTFCKEPIRAKALRVAMSKWASDIGYPNAEIFPKQDHLEADADGEKRLGNWINLCYFGGNDTNRYTLLAPDQKATIDQFVTIAESIRLSQHDISAAVDTAHAGAPPCIQRMLSGGVPAGTRNEAMYNITVYLKRANPNTYLDDALDINSTVFDPPLPTAEAKRTIKSASRRDYKYKCQLEPLKSLCDSKLCLKREYGITRGEYDEMSANDMLPSFSNVVKYLTDPVKWGIQVNGMLITNIPTEVLYNFEALKNRITETLTIGVPSITKRNWESKIIPLISTAREVRLPDDASVSGIVGGRLREFLDKANLNGTDEMKEREKILRGIPCVMEIEGSKCLAFRAMDFVKYLKSVKSEEVKGPNLWFALNNLPDMPLDHARVSVKGKKLTVWYTPLSGYDRAEYPVPQVKPEF